jgi:hypothetical protein
MILTSGQWLAGHLMFQFCFVSSVHLPDDEMNPAHGRARCRSVFHLRCSGGKSFLPLFFEDIAIGVSRPSPSWSAQSPSLDVGGLGKFAQSRLPRLRRSSARGRSQQVDQHKKSGVRWLVFDVHPILIGHFVVGHGRLAGSLAGPAGTFQAGGLLAAACSMV